jgi:hypothetical protein
MFESLCVFLEGVGGTTMLWKLISKFHSKSYNKFCDFLFQEVDRSFVLNILFLYASIIESVASFIT